MATRIRKPLDKLQNKGVEVYRTDLLGDIYCTSDGKEVSFTSGEYHDENRIEAGSAADSKDEQDKASLVIDETYVLNTSTMKFHKPDCSVVESMSQKNRIDYMGPAMSSPGRVFGVRDLQTIKIAPDLLDKLCELTTIKNVR